MELMSSREPLFGKKYVSVTLVAVAEKTQIDG